MEPSAFELMPSLLAVSTDLSVIDLRSLLASCAVAERDHFFVSRHLGALCAEAGVVRIQILARHGQLFVANDKGRSVQAGCKGEEMAIVVNIDSLVYQLHGTFKPQAMPRCG